MIKLKPTFQQKSLIKTIFDVSRFVYNKANAIAKEDISQANFQNLRNRLVTLRTKRNNSSYEEMTLLVDAKAEEIKNCLDSEMKELLIEERNILMKQRVASVKTEESEINKEIRPFELEVSKEIRANAVKNLCDAYKTASANLKAGNIKFFNIGYKKKNDPRQCAELSSKDIKMTKKGIQICPSKFGNDNKFFKLGKKNHKKYKDIIIKSNCDLVKRNDGYYIGLVLDTEKKDNEVFEKFCGVDPGVRTFLTCYGSNGIVEYNHNRSYLEKLRKTISDLKDKRAKKQKKKIRKNTLTKIDVKEKNFIDDVHWKSINSLLKINDVIFFGDIKSHGIVKEGKNRTLNRQMNGLKFFLFKSRLDYKAKLFNKKVVFVNEAYTTQGCSSCGNLSKTVGSSEIYKCQNKNCKSIYGRDINSAKNMVLKGLLS